MVKFERKNKTFQRLGHIYDSEELTFRMANFEEIMKVSSEWMKEKFGDRFVSFELRPDFHDMYVSRIRDGLDDTKNHLNDKCVIFSTGKQWRASLYHDKIVGYKCGV